MLANAIKLADLIERGHRAGVAGAGRGKPPGEADADRIERPRPAVKDNLERLGVELISLSRTPTGDPRALIREALLAIESCLEAIKRHN